ncbi:MAG: hypothetical protein ACYDC3_09700 [Candidatus Binataceae bacterium]
MAAESALPVSAKRASAPARISLVRYSPAFLLLATVLMIAYRWPDPDLWWHIFSGRAILATHHLVFPDPYSYTSAGAPSHTQEWLSDVIMAVVYNHFGVLGLRWLNFAVAATTIFFLAMIAAETAAGPTLQFAVVLSAAIAMGPLMQIRPQMFDYAMLSALLWMLTRYNFGRHATLWIAIPILALWANLHGSYFLPVAVLFLNAGVAGTVGVWTGAELRRAIRTGTIAICAAIATLATPFGVNSWITVAHTMMNPLNPHLSEWRPFATVIATGWSRGGLGNFNYLIVLAMMAAAVAAIIIRPRGRDLPMIAIAAFTCAGAFMAIRAAAYAVLAMVEPLANHFGLWLGAPEEPPRRQALAFQAAIVALAIAVGAGTGLFSRSLDAGDMPNGAVAFMRAHDLRGNVLARFDWSFYLLWHRWPDARVFIDTRYDLLYPNRVIMEYLAFDGGGSAAARVLDEYPTDYVLIAPDAAAFATMTRQHGWVLIYRDSGAALFARAGSAAARIAGAPMIAERSPAFFP